MWSCCVRPPLHPQTSCSTRRRRRGAAQARSSPRSTDARSPPAQFQQRLRSSRCRPIAQSSAATSTTQLLRQLGIDQQILQQMIDEQAALIEAERHGIRVSDDELAQQIFSIPGAAGERPVHRRGSATSSCSRCRSPPMRPDEFEDRSGAASIVDKLRAALTDWMTVSDADLDDEYKQRNEKVKLQVVALPADKFRDEVTVTDAEVAKHFEDAQGRLPHRRAAQGQYLLARSEGLRQRAAVPASRRRSATTTTTSSSTRRRSRCAPATSCSRPTARTKRP